MSLIIDKKLIELLSELETVASSKDMEAVIYSTELNLKTMFLVIKGNKRIGYWQLEHGEIIKAINKIKTIQYGMLNL